MTIPNIPEDCEIYFRVAESDIGAGQSLVEQVSPGALFEPVFSSGDDLIRHFITFPIGAFSELNPSSPLLVLGSPETYVTSIDDWGFNVRLGLAYELRTVEAFDSLTRLAQAIGSVAPAVLITSDSQTPLIDTRPGENAPK